ncbi:Putative glycoside hydrolase, family 3, glycoside hydrolase family 3 domain, immunoglobulin [Colletotrichum destructivum]|uniref:beta-glucosidase n=1 Tax=Colletotrichum destructivum TaxID=34406 RepID=A0AAX4IQB9_9PEZI|nr:Putative glycoside hydrolase, family 3, glycoside hydrolase family 3 domain, immunoglobulin [Colletotrichum destructivum]
MKSLTHLLYFLLASSALAVQPWLDKALSTEERLLSFIAQLNDTQKHAMVQGDTEVSIITTTATAGFSSSFIDKFTQLTDNGTGVNACIGHIQGNSTLGIPDICMGDGPAGVGNSLDNVTAFPAPVMAASSWNTSLQYEYGQALAQEHLGKGRNIVLAPTINILRSPLWARAAETLSEDPWLTARMAVAGTMGIQSQGALACPKHLAAYNQDTNRFGIGPAWVTVNPVVDKRTMHELYLPAFKASVQEADAASVMCSYNRLNGSFTCENDWLLNTTLRQDWGFKGFVVADWYFSTRSTVKAVMAGLDISMPGGDLTNSYGFPAYYGDLLAEAINNGSIPRRRLDDMVERVWRYMFKLGQVDNPVKGDSTAHVRTQEHLDLAQRMVEDGAVLLKNAQDTLPISSEKYSKIAVFGIGATAENQVSENHGGFVIDSTMVVQAPLDALQRRGSIENISVEYAETYPGTGQFPTAPSRMFRDGGVNVTYYKTTDFSGPVIKTDFVPNITIATYPSELWKAYPDVFSAIYEATFLPNTTGMYHFSMYGQGTALLYLDDVLLANMSFANFGNYVQGNAYLKYGSEHKLVIKYDMGYSLSTGGYGVTLGVDVGNETRDSVAEELAGWADLSIILASDRLSEGADNGMGLSLPGDQNALISRLAGLSKRTVVILNTNSAVLMPWIKDVDGVMEIWYPGQQVGLALERLLFGDVSPSGKLPLTFPKSLKDTIQINTDIDVPYSEGLYVGYKAYDQSGVKPLFSFGHGLTYSTFNLEDLEVSLTKDSFVARATLRNEGARSAKQVVQLYVGYPDAAKEPPKLLRAFEKTEVEAGGAEIVELVVKFEDLKIWDDDTDEWRLVGGQYEILLGFSASDIRLQQTLDI